MTSWAKKDGFMLAFIGNLQYFLLSRTKQSDHTFFNIYYSSSVNWDDYRVGAQAPKTFEEMLQEEGLSFP